MVVGRQRLRFKLFILQKVGVLVVVLAIDRLEVVLREVVDLAFVDRLEQTHRVRRLVSLKLPGLSFAVRRRLHHSGQCNADRS